MGKLLRRMRGFKTSCKCIMRDIVINSIGGGVRYTALVTKRHL